MIKKEYLSGFANHFLNAGLLEQDEPLIRFVDHFIQDALQHAASDIHIEPHTHHCRIRYRISGILYEIANLPLHLASRITMRLKVMAKLDTAEKRLPQDGRFKTGETDIRLSTCPTLFGEKCVLRLLDLKKTALHIDGLGMTLSQLQCFLKHLSHSHGLILVTGPTGSGKSITLYSALTHLNTPDKNISTIEDPVEIQLNGINQVHMNAKMGLHFETALRSFLRQDPDIIMVGEIRDTETAEIVMHAAQTGHLVLSTLHTNSAVDTLHRLQLMGIAPYNLIYAITLIIAQRLVRVLCPHCKKKDPLTQTFQAVGCSHCQEGYYGRKGIFELLELTPSLQQAILKQASPSALKNLAQKNGSLTLYENALQCVSEGETSLNEIQRVLTP